MEKIKDMDSKLEIKQFKREVSSCDYWNKKIIGLNLELEAIEVELYEVSAVSYGDRLVVDGEEINYKVNGSTNPYNSSTTSLFNKVERERQILEQIERCVSKIDYCREVLSYCSKEVKNVMIRMLILGERHDIIAHDIGRSRTQMYRDIDNEICKSLLLYEKRTKS